MPPSPIGVNPASPDVGARSGSHADEPTRVSGGGVISAAPDAAAGDAGLIEGYIIEQEIHRGGQGVVYRAIQVGTKRRVALKVLLEGPFASATTRRRFEREVELAASLRHPNIVTILDSGASFGRYFFAMEYIEGTRLDRYLAQHRPPLDHTLNLLERICTAINFAHQRGVIHRDLKPPNILVDAEGEPHILDFGLAKPVQPISSDDPTVQMLSTSGQILGTIAYMSPEQTRNAQDADVRSDVYSLGVVFYEALLGRLPYSVDGPLAEVLTRIANEEPVRPRSLRSLSRFTRRIDDELETILLKALEKDPARRYQTAGELGRDLRHLRLGEPIEAKRASGFYMFKKTLRRYKLQATAALLVFLSLLGFMVSLLIFYKQERVLREDAMTAKVKADRAAHDAQEAKLEAERAAQDARTQAAEALLAKQQMQRAVVRQKLQAGDLALERGDLIEARDSYWDAFADDPGPATRWALRQYYEQTPDVGSVVLEFQHFGPSALSPDGRWALVCDSPDSVSIRDLSNDHTVRWLGTPGPVRVAYISDRGAVVAAGDGWARLWDEESEVPTIAVELPTATDVSAIYPVLNRDALALVLVDRVVVLGDAGRRRTDTPLAGKRTGTTDFSPALQMLAIPTEVGVQTISFSADAPPRSEIVWQPGGAAPRAVQFSGANLLGILADAVYVGTVAGEGRGQWQSFIEDAGTWEMFDLREGASMVALGTRDGRVAVFRSGELDAQWRITLGALLSLRIGAERELITVDDHSTVTRWVATHRKERPLEVSRAASAAWAVSDDQSTVLIAEDSGRIIVQRAGASGPTTIRGPRMFDAAIPGLGTVLLAINRDGKRAILAEGSRVRLVELPERGRSYEWSERFVNLSAVALSGDGEVIATLVQGPSGEQRISFWRWAPADAATPRGSAPNVEPLGQPFEFVGAEVRGIGFVPNAARLLVLRSNGQMYLLDPLARRPTPPADLLARQSPLAEPWMVLESPPTTFAFDRSGRRLAVASEDGAIRLVDVPGGAVARRLLLGQAARALSFSADDELLLVRSATGAISLYELDTGARVSHWTDAAGPAAALATWIGDRGAILVNDADGVFEHTYRSADRLIEQNQPYARQRRIARLVADGQLQAAWSESAGTAGDDPERVRGVRERLLDMVLRIPSRAVPPDWIEPVTRDAPDWTFLRLGHAAYGGERYDPAGGWFERAFDLSGGAIDAYSLLRLAQTAYLAMNYSRAAEEFAQVVQAADFDSRDAPTVLLQCVAALVLSGRSAEARSAAQQLGDVDSWNPSMATVTASKISRFLVGIETRSLMLKGLEELFSRFGDQWLNYRDDSPFFEGELARRDGHVRDAALDYQRCIDLARDRWPANWARYRLNQLGARGN